MVFLLLSKLMMLSRSGFFSFFLASVLVFSYMIPSATDFTSLQDSEVENTSENVSVSSPETDISSGSYSGTEFQAMHSLTNKNGEELHFWVKNNGVEDVKISINGEESSVLKPAEDGEISVKLSQLTSDYNFKVAPTPNGGEIDIDYAIIQSK